MTEYKRLGDYIRPVDVRNRELKVTNLLGVSISKEFMPSIANTFGTDMSTYKIVEPGQFAYGPVTSRNGDKVSIALLDGYDDAIISQAYTVFEVDDHEQLWPEYLMMWFRRLLLHSDIRLKKTVKNRQKAEHAQLYSKCIQLKLTSADGKKYATDCFAQDDIEAVVKNLPARNTVDFKRDLSLQNLRF